MSGCKIKRSRNLPTNQERARIKAIEVKMVRRVEANVARGYLEAQVQDSRSRRVSEC